MRIRELTADHQFLLAKAARLLGTTVRAAHLAPELFQLLEPHLTLEMRSGLDQQYPLIALGRDPRRMTAHQIPSLAAAFEHAKIKASTESAPPESVEGQESAPASSPDVWYLLDGNGARFGPVSKSALDQWLCEGRIDARCQLFREGSDDWVLASDVYAILAAQAVQQPPDVDQATVGHASLPDRGGPSDLITLPDGDRSRFANIGSIDHSRSREVIHRYGLAHKATETFQHAFGGSFGVAMGWTLGKFVAGFLIMVFCCGGCLVPLGLALRSLDTAISQSAARTPLPRSDTGAEADETTSSAKSGLPGHLGISRQEFRRKVRSFEAYPNGYQWSGLSVEDGVQGILRQSDFDEAFGKPLREQALSTKRIWYWQCTDGAVQVLSLDPDQWMGQVPNNAVYLEGITDR